MATKATPQQLAAQRAKSIARIKRLFTQKRLGATQRKGKYDTGAVYSGPVQADGQPKNFCIVGGMLSLEQLQDIKRRRLNGQMISEVTKAVGINNVEAATGFKVAELKQLQLMHDEMIIEGLDVHSPSGRLGKKLASLK